MNSSKYVIINKTIGLIYLFDTQEIASEAFETLKEDNPNYTYAYAVADTYSSGEEILNSEEYKKYYKDYMKCEPSPHYFCLCSLELGYDNIVGIFNSEEAAQKALRYELNNGNKDYYIISGPFYENVNQYIGYMENFC